MLEIISSSSLHFVNAIIIRPRAGPNKTIVSCISVKINLKVPTLDKIAKVSKRKSKSDWLKRNVLNTINNPIHLK